MAKEFAIPRVYKSDIIGAIKRRRADQDTRKSDLSPTVLDLGPVSFQVARFFGFCYGVENAIEIAYRAIEENPGKRVFLLSEMIHNPHVNADLLARGVRFLQRVDGTPLVPFTELTPEDVVIVPAFGTTVEHFRELESRGIDPQRYNATCPFVERVWKRGKQLASQDYTIVIHGKHTHEETRATFSHIRREGASIVVRDMAEARHLAAYVRGDLPIANFYDDFKGRYSDGFSAEHGLSRLGVVNQTTMLAEETHAIAQLMRDALIQRFGEVAIADHYADTRDTLCYATSENQRAMKGLLVEEADLAIVVGGYNSSNTSHLVELCEGRVPAFYIKDAGEIVSCDEIRHLDLHTGKIVTTSNWLPVKRPVRISLSAGASCPDAMVESVMSRVAELFNEEDAIPVSQALQAT